ncbi:hypothetical protein Rctr197k_196 [Virus Rctr197k]|nr:hypothetical protein Rctr197k_196 [Virus Rctr197k]
MGDGTRVNRWAYEKMIAGDLEWLRKMPSTIERRHIELVLERSADHEYGPKPTSAPVLHYHRVMADGPLSEVSWVELSRVQELERHKKSGTWILLTTGHYVWAVESLEELIASGSK